MATVYFIGAGPGDPELITLKAVDRIGRAGLILYAGSLVPREVFIPHIKIEANKIIDTASLALEEIMGFIREAVSRGEDVARIHTGDPSIFGAIYEQMVMLECEGIEYEIVPGVSSAMAAAAVLKSEFTVPLVTQTVIFTRMEGATPVPECERIESLAAHNSSMVIFLSAARGESVRNALLTHHPSSTPVAIAYKVGWPDQKIFRTIVAHIPETLAENGIGQHALILVGSAFDAVRRSDLRSVLYGEQKLVGKGE